MALDQKYFIDGEPEPGLEGNLAQVYFLDGLPEDLIEAAAPPASTITFRRTLSMVGTRAGARQVVRG